MNEARFYVTELAGYFIHADIRPCRTAAPSIVCSVLDRAYCHRVVAHYAEPMSGGIPGRQDYPTKARRQAWPRETAAAEAARLNAWDAAA